MGHILRQHESSIAVLSLLRFCHLTACAFAAVTYGISWAIVQGRWKMKWRDSAIERMPEAFHARSADTVFWVVNDFVFQLARITMEWIGDHPRTDATDSALALIIKVPPPDGRPDMRT